MSTQTRSQKYAQQAYSCVSQRTITDKYKTFAKKFPALVHTCGLAQAVAFAEVKEHTDYLDDLASVVRAAGHADVTDRGRFAQLSRESSFAAYMRLSRNAITAASWIKRYVEALAPSDTEGGE